ncbi:hypothetical protein HMPREF0539_2296 [Lacticaseibacillus rhamnosus LMS2-1]|uniref:Uncharacterized protein n=1 Tax=Lacticaseibacillus rhamnosus (strain LMS2-1) TaxID=525361 RepID=C2JZG1_LACRM|nr:hypothetical protein LRHK_2159 [Lacticaseibacillus rhamnosus ATCC 8530]EEN79509.1 hypothetical protein HMPREF0539_2296 [Lacticaseibacillus rhamnosus LMS2-1]
MAKPGPSRLRPLTLRLLTAPARAYTKIAAVDFIKSHGCLFES